MKDLIKKQTNMIRKESGMKLVIEKKDLDSKHIEKVSKMTDRNNHLGARTHLSYYLEGGKLALVEKDVSFVQAIRSPEELRSQ